MPKSRRRNQVASTAAAVMNEPTPSDDIAAPENGAEALLMAPPESEMSDTPQAAPAIAEPIAVVAVTAPTLRSLTQGLTVEFALYAVIWCWLYWRFW